MKDDGFWKSYEILDKEYQRLKFEKNNFKLFADFLSWWWDFGYHKEWVITKRAPLLFGIFFLINIFLFKKLYELYPIEFLSLRNDNNIQKSESTLKIKLNLLFNVLIYTLIILFYARSLPKLRKYF